MGSDVIYATIPWHWQHLINVVRVLLALTILFIGLPAFMFPDGPSGRGSGGVTALQRALWMVFLAMVIVHFLSATRLYEAVVFLGLCLGAGIVTRVRRYRFGSLRLLTVDIVAWAFAWLEGRRPGLPWRPLLQAATGRLLAKWKRPPAGSIALLAVLGVSAWMRFAESFATPSPIFSDAPVNLAWMSYLANNLLYRNEVYPRGMYVFLSLIRKFTALNGVEVLAVAGPLFGMGILLSLLFFVYKATRSWWATVVACLVYGTLPQLLPIEIDRIASHNSQEFAFMFVLPAAWYTHAYVRHGQWADLLAAAAAAGITAFTHPVPGVSAVLTMAATAVAGLMTACTITWKRLVSIVGATTAAGAVAITPLSLALLFGQQWHGSSVKFLTEQLPAELGPVPPLATGTITAAIVLCIGAVWHVRRRHPALAAGPPGLAAGPSGLGPGYAAAAAVVAVSPVLYVMPYIGVRSEALAARGGELYGLGLALGAGLAWACVELLLRRRQILCGLLAATLVAASWATFPPEPPRPYHYYSDEQIRLYLWADRTFWPGDWTLVMGHTGYALSVGRSFHQEVHHFLEMAGQLPELVADWSEAASDLGFGLTNYYVLVVERTVPLAPGQPPETAWPRLAAADDLQQWIEKRQNSAPLVQIFDGNEVAVWVLSLPDAATAPVAGRPP